MGEEKRPAPPPGYIPFKWKTKPYKHDRNIKIDLCPHCGGEGSVWSGGGFQDTGVLQFLENLIKEEQLNSYEIWIQKYEGVMVKEHWSRFGEGECLRCGVKYWHDFIGYPWHYYYNPETSLIKKDYQPRLF